MRNDLCLNPKQFNLSEIRALKPLLNHLLNQHQVQAAYLFGSVLNESSHPLSDLDIAVIPPANLPDWLNYYSDLYSDLCQLFGADNIDLVLLNQAPLSLQARIISIGEPLLKKQDVTEFEERVSARYADLASWRQENWHSTRNLVRQGITKSINMIDQNRVERFIFLIRDAVAELQSLNLESVGLEAYLQNKRLRALSEHYLRIALEATLDLGRHVIVKTGLGIPQEYRDIGKILAQKGIVSHQLGQELEAMAGMRNMLVHLYWEINYPLLYRTIVQRQSTFEQYLKQIFDYLERLRD